MPSRTAHPASILRHPRICRSAFPDADEERAARQLAHRVRRGKPHAYVSMYRERELTRGDLSTEKGPCRDRKLSSPTIAPTNCAARRKSCMLTATASPTSPARWSRSLTSPRSPRIEDMVGAPVHPLRFRGNVYVEGWPAWSELDLVGKELRIGRDARLKVVKRIVRCAATNVDPETGIRDLEVPKALLRTSRSRRLRDLCRGGRGRARLRRGTRSRLGDFL